MSSLADRSRGAPAAASKPLRCAIYTRKSTEYGLDLRIPIQAGHPFRDEAGQRSDLKSDGVPR